MIAIAWQRSRHVGNNVRRENDDDVLPDRAQQIVKAHALFRIESGSWLVDDDQLRISQQRLRDSESLLHASRETAQRLPAVLVQIGLLQERSHDLAPLFRVR